MNMSRVFLAAFWYALIAGCATAGEVVKDSPALPAASTQPVLVGRDTPEGAMNVYEQALARGDVATVADSYNMRDARTPAMAKMLILNYQFQQELAAHLSPGDVEKVSKECRLFNKPTSRPFVADDWDQHRAESGIVYGKSGQAPMMQRGGDGIWRMGRIWRRPAAMAPDLAARVADMDKRQEQISAESEKRFVPVITNLKAGKYATADDVINALYPEGSPAQQVRRMQARRKADDAKQEQLENQQLLAQHFDSSTVEGAVGSFMQSLLKRDRAGLERFFYAADDKDGRLAKAQADRILIGSALTDALKKQFGADERDDMGGRFALPIDAPEWFSPIEVHADTAIGQSPGTKKMHFRKIDGIWKEDITSSIPAAKRAEKMEQTNAAVEKVISEVLAGKYKKTTEVDEVIKNAKLDEAYHELEPEEGQVRRRRPPMSGRAGPG